VASLSQFSRRINAVATKVSANADKTVRRAALAADQAVVLGTPVDKGRARSNWLVDLDGPRRAQVEAAAPGAGGSTGGENATAAIAAASAKIARYNGDINRSIVIHNNLPYIDALNKGSSQQAPAGFVEKAVQSAVARVRSARLTR